MRNNNKPVVRKIIRNSLKSNRGRNIFLILAIMLTTFLIGSVFSISMGLLESLKMQQTRLVGSVAHAALSNPTPEQLSKVNTLDYIQSAGFGMKVGSLYDMPEIAEMDINLIYMDDPQWYDIQAPAFSDIVGNAPEKPNEIMISRHVLEKLGITNPSISMSIPLSFTLDGGKTIKQETFVLSGFYTSYMQVYTGSWSFIRISAEFINSYENLANTESAINFIFKSSSRVNEYIEKLKIDLQISESQNILPSPVFDISNEAQVANFVVLAVLVVLFVLTGYLLIYNVLYISVSKDIRFFGLLKTVGTTPNQIKRVVIGQVVRLGVIGIPIGLALSVLISFVTVPAVVLGSGVNTGVEISFSPIIFIGSAFFSLMTAIIGAISPARKASRISPIEAARYTGEDTKTKTIHWSSINGKPRRMAIRNILREKKRAEIVLLSLFLGVTTFISVITIISSMDLDGYIKRYYSSDFMLSNDVFVRAGNIYKQVFDKEIMQSFSELPGLEDAELTTSAYGEMKYTPEAFSDYLDAYMEEQKKYGDAMTKEQHADNFVGLVCGIDEAAVLALNQDRPLPIDVEAFMRGEIALISTDNPELFRNVNDIETVMEASGKMLSVGLGGFVPKYYKGMGVYEAPTIFVSNTVLKTLVEDPIIRTVNINVQDENEEQVNAALKELLADNNDIFLVSKMEGRQGFKDAKIILTTLGGGIALILALIGIMNFINVMSVSIMVRKREFATLQSIGMTGGHLRGVLRFEGVGYAVATLLMVATAGNAIAFGLFKLFQTQVDYVVFTYPVIPVLVVVLVIFAVCVAVPELVYQTLNKTTIVERLREAE